VENIVASVNCCDEIVPVLVDGIGEEEETGTVASAVVGPGKAPGVGDEEVGVDGSVRG